MSILRTETFIFLFFFEQRPLNYYQDCYKIVVQYYEDRIRNQTDLEEIFF